jgi:dTDP-4-dehydrorhamnose reductase
VTRIVVTGKKGQVAMALQERAAARPDIDLVALGRPQLDLEDLETVVSAIVETAPDLVVNAAAYTAVDRAEDEPELAHRINALGAEAVARAAAHLDVPVVQISTDYVFSGESGRPYSEQDEPDPHTVYGRTKLDGEQRVAAANPRHLILRTAWVYSPFGNNFVKTVLKLAGDRDQISLVEDQTGSPTSAFDIADAILAILERLSTAPEFTDWGVYHFAGTGHANWAELAEAAFAISAELGGPQCAVVPIPSSAYPTKARRPANSRLDCSRFSRVFGVTAPHWQHSLRLCIESLSIEWQRQQNPGQAGHSSPEGNQGQ